MVISWDRMWRVAGQPGSILEALEGQFQAAAAAAFVTGLFFEEVDLELLWSCSRFVCIFSVKQDRRWNFIYRAHVTPSVCDHKTSVIM